MTFIPSEQQKAFFNWIVTGKGSCVLEAVAGSGKTTTLIEGLKLMKGDIFFGAFNKSIVVEIQEKVNNHNISNVNVSTFHAAGLSAWKKVVKFIKVDANKCKDLYKTMFSFDDNKYMSAVVNLVSYAKQTGLDILEPSSEENWLSLIEYYNVDCIDEELKVVHMAKQLFSASIRADYTIIDFDDMIFAPLYHKAKLPKYNWVLIDESQDINDTKRLMALMMMAPESRLVAVGDKSQCIYTFTGANHNSMEIIAEATNAVKIPLTVTYRCPKNIVAEAQKFVSNIIAHESAKEGKISYLTAKDDITTFAKAGDAILCRFNAPIIKLVYKFISKGIPAKVEGRDIANGLTSLARRWKVKKYSTLQDRIDDYLHREIVKLTLKGKDAAVNSLNDKVDCLRVVIDRCIETTPNSADAVVTVCDEINRIFGDNVGSNQVILSTIHKSKGREFPKVFWLQGKELKTKQAWEAETERNLKYVAITRSQDELIYVPEIK